MQTDATYAIADLARLTGLNVRTIRYYIAQGLIPASGESGPGAHYGQGHLDRLRLTKRLQAQHLPLAEIRAQLAALGDDEVAELLTAEAKEVEAPQTSALEYVRRLLTPSFPPHLKMQAGLFRTPPEARRYAHAVEETEPMAVAESNQGVATLAAPPAASPAGAAPAMPRMKDVPPAAALPAPPALPAPRATSKPPTAAERPLIEPRGSTPQSPERSQWERLSLGPNLELHVRRPLSRVEQRRVERLITIARQVLKEDGV